MARSYYKFIFNFIRACQTVFQSGSPLCIPSSADECQFFYVLSTLGMASLFKYSHSMRYTSHYGFNLHFSSSSQCWESFHMLICYTCIFFGEVFVQNIFPHILWCYLVFLQLHFESCLYFSIQVFFLSEICFENIFPICGLSFHTLKKVIWRVI